MFIDYFRRFFALLRMTELAIGNRRRMSIDIAQNLVQRRQQKDSALAGKPDPGKDWYFNTLLSKITRSAVILSAAKELLALYK